MYFETLTTALLVFILYQISDIKKKVYDLGVKVENLAND